MTATRSLPELLKDLHEEFDVLGGGADATFRRIMPIMDGDPADLAFIDRPGDGAAAQVERSPARVVMVRRTWGEANRAALLATGKVVVLVAQPRLVAGRLLKALYPGEDPFEPGIHPTAIVSDGARVHPGAGIGPFCVVGDSVIGEGSMISPFVRIRDGVEIGRGVHVREHANLGSPGFGIVRNETDGTLLRIPHVGRAVIEDGVEIFPFANVDRGTLTDTRIGRGSMIDHYVHVAHNVQVGEDAIVTASSVLCGSSRVGARAWIGVGTLVKEGVSVGDDATTGLGAVVIRDVPAGAVVAGVPARPLPSRKSDTGIRPA